MKGLIFSIKRYSVHDGPGIRVTVFMKGCPLSCWWCHNPEGISPAVESVVRTKKIGEKEFEEKEEAGKYYSVADIIDILEKDRIFFSQSGGGVTFSGGEPLMQTGFLEEALRACRAERYHTAVDTSGYSPAANYLKILPFTSLFLFDIKHLDSDRHSEYTGVPNKIILDNLRMILESGTEVMLRIPVIPGKNDDAEHLSALREFINGIRKENLTRICLLPFHRIGASKYSRFGLPYRMGGAVQPSPERMKELKEYFSTTGIKIRIGG